MEGISNIHDIHCEYTHIHRGKPLIDFFFQFSLYKWKVNVRGNPDVQNIFFFFERNALFDVFFNKNSFNFIKTLFIRV